MSARVDEIRFAYRQGDVPREAVEWLCTIADLAERIADPTVADAAAAAVAYVPVSPAIVRELQEAF